MENWMPKQTAFSLALILAWAGSLLTPTNARAGDAAWSSAAANGAWETGANWIGGTSPGATNGVANPDSATFNSASTTLTIVPDANRNIRNVAFSTGSVGAYVVGTTGGNKLLLSSGGLLSLDAAVNAVQTVNAPLVLQGDGGTYTVSNDSGKTLTLGGGITGSATGANVTTLTLAGAGLGGITAGGIIGNGTGGGKLALAVSGGGTNTLNGANTFTGGATLTAGVLKLGNSTALGTTAGTLTLSGGTLDIALGSVTLNAYNTVVGGNATILSDRSASGQGWQYLLGTLNIGANTLTINKGPNITGAGHRVQFGTTTLSGNAIFDNNGGTVLMIGQAGQVLGNYNITFQSSDGTGLSSLRAGSASTRAAGATILSNGYLALNSTATGQILGTTATTLQLNGGTLDLQVDTSILAYPTSIGGNVTILSDRATSASAGITQTLGTLSVGANTVSVSGGGSATSGAANLVFGATTLTGDVTFSVTNGTGSSTTTLTLGPVGESGGSRKLTKTGASGTLALSGAGTYSGGTVVSGGTCRVANGASVGSGNVTVAPGATLDLQTSSGIASLAMITLQTNATQFGVANLAAGVTDVVSQIVLGPNVYSAAGTYGATNSGADNAFANFFTGTGVLKILPRIAPAISNGGASLIGQAAARLNGTITAGYPAPAVYICYGASNGGTTSTSGWSTVIPLGPQSGAFFAEARGLTPASTYYYTCFATNDSGAAWATPALSFTTATSASAYIWNSANSGNWDDTTTNGWNTGGAYPHIDGDIVTFGQTALTATRTITNDVDARIGTMKLLSGDATKAWRFEGPNALVFDSPTGSAVLTCAVSTASHTCSVAVALSTNLNLDLVGSISFTNTINGAGGLQKNAAGTLSLAGSNGFAGGVSLNAGTLVLKNAAALGRGTFVINGGVLATDAARTLTTGNALVLNGSFGAGYNAPSLNLGNGPVTLASNVTVTVSSQAYGANTFTFGGTISDAGNNRSLTVYSADSQPGGLTLSSSNAFSGGVTLAGGSLTINNNYALGTGPMRFNGGSLGAASGTVIANTNAIYLGTLSLVSGAGSTIYLGQGPMFMTNNATINVGANTLIINRPISDGGGNFRLTISSGNSFGANTLSLNGANTFGGGLSFNPGGGYGYDGQNYYLNLGYLGTDTTASALGTGPFKILQSSAGSLKLLPVLDNTSGADGTLATCNAQVWSNSFTFKGSKSLNMGTGAVTLGTNVTITVSANTFAIGGQIGDGNRGYSLTKGGGGTFLVTASNTYGGGTTISTGRLSVVGGTLGTGSVHVGSGGVLDLQTGNAIGDTATLQLDNVAGIYGVASLSNSVPEIIGALILGGTTYAHPGTYGGPNSNARQKIAGFFVGTGVVEIRQAMTLLFL